MLRGVNREVATGSILALLGANGAGKTTLIKILSTLLKPDAGAGAVNGFSVTTAPAQVHESIRYSSQSASPASSPPWMRSTRALTRRHAWKCGRL